MKKEIAELDAKMQEAERLLKVMSADLGEVDSVHSTRNSEAGSVHSTTCTDEVMMLCLSPAAIATRVLRNRLFMPSI